MVTGELSPDRGGPEPGMGHEGPASDGAPPGEAASILNAIRDYAEMRAPEGMTLDRALLSKAQGILDAGHADKFHHNAQLQHLVDLSHEMAQSVREEATRHQRKVWDEYTNGLKDEVRKDPEIGGARTDVATRRAEAVVTEYLPPANAQKLLSFMEYSGAGNYPEIIRLLNTIGEKLNIFETGITPANVRQPTNMGQRSGGGRGWYPNMGGDR
jgi:hypothetical protein